MIDSGDILDVLRQRFAANAAAVSGISGGLHDGRAVGDTAGVYGVVSVDPQEPQYTGTGAYVQAFRAKIDIYAGAGVASQTALGLLDAALVLSTRTTYTTTTGTTPVLHIKRVGGAWKLDDQRSGGSDVRTVSPIYEVMVEG